MNFSLIYLFVLSWGILVFRRISFLSQKIPSVNFYFREYLIFKYVAENKMLLFFKNYPLTIEKLQEILIYYYIFSFFSIKFIKNFVYYILK